ncbi:MAG TPA: hypothetical protein VF426_05715 [Marmoricola sp.]
MGEMMQIEEIENMLRGELDEVAGSLRVPAQPASPGEAPQRPHRWVVPVAVAAAVVLVLGGITLALNHSSHRTPQPTTIPKSLPQVPFVVGRTLYVDGKSMPGKWALAASAHDTWVAVRPHDWTWGVGRTVHRLPDLAHDTMPVVSSDGAVLAYARKAGGVRVLSTSTGRTLGTWHVKLGNQESSNAFMLSAVTSPQVRVLLIGGSGGKVWSLDGGSVHRLSTNRMPLWSTPAGVVFSDNGLKYHLGTIDDAGHVHLTTLVPRADLAALSADDWSLRGASMKLAGPRKDRDRVATVLNLLKLGTSHQVQLKLPSGWGASSSNWEAPGRIIIDGVPLGHAKVKVSQHRLIRCVVSLKRCAVVGG